MLQVRHLFTAELRYCRYSSDSGAIESSVCAIAIHPAIANRSADAYPCGALAYSDQGPGFVVSSIRDD